GTALEKLATSEVDLAVASGMPPAQARAAGEVFKMAVAAQLSRGVSPAVATARAAAVFKIEASFPKSPPQVTTARSFAASFNSSTAASSMKTLAGTSTGSGGAAFDQRLSNVLRAGANFAEAVSRAQAAGQIMDNLAKADATPRGTLTGSNSRPLPSMSGPQQKALGNLLALGIPPDQANRMATSVGAANAAAIQADARNPQVGMATGNIAAVKSSGAQPGFDKALAVAMLGGMPVQASIERAQRIETEMQRLAGADRNNPLSTLANGTSAPANASRNEDRALAQALLSGKSPAEAQAMAQKIAEILAPEKPSALTTLASGKSIETLLSSPGNSRTYRQVLSKALERGMPLGQAVNMATQAEAANAVRAPLPQSVADMVKRNPATVAMASEQGAPLPSWLLCRSRSGSPQVISRRWCRCLTRGSKAWTEWKRGTEVPLMFPQQAYPVTSSLPPLPPPGNHWRS
ncbi:MAG: hypothetical protein NTX56_02390, partial [Proteobacteria bacterium]|nr:hypothetical protein [Pseudomonadota bacterium]